MEAQLVLRRAAASPCVLSAKASASRLARCTASPLSATPSGSFVVQHQQRRTKMTAARTKRALNIPPHPSFLEEHVGEDEFIIINPPSSEASPFHTPFKFLPKSDPRRRANVAALFNSSNDSVSPFYQASTTEESSSSSPSASSIMPPPLPKQPAKPSLKDFYNITPEQLVEMRALRTEDPVKWSITALARKYNTSKMFAMIATGSKTMTEHRKKMEEELEKIKERWGPKRTKAREDKYKRREMLLRGELG